MGISNLEGFICEFTNLIKNSDSFPEILEEGSNMMRELVLSPLWLNDMLAKLVQDEAYMKSQWLNVDFNELKLYRSPDRMFSVRGFIWEPGIVYPIHDHGAWGIVGAQMNKIREKKFVRLDDGSNSAYSEIIEIKDTVLSPGEISCVMALEEGIHQMSAVNDMAFSLHLYGMPVRKGYINYFDEDTKAVRRIYSDSIKKRILAIRMLGSVCDKWAESILIKTMDATNNENIKNECRESLMRMGE
ncbi:MAG: hypothetical protein AB9844_12555 [Clostridiaceae bacterium]